MYWILDGKTPKKTTFNGWAEFFETDRRILKRDYYQRHGQRIFTSTVFLGIDVGFGPPVLFETMVFGGEALEGIMMARRWFSFDEAMDGHDMLLQRAKVEILGVKLGGKNGFT